MRIDNYVMIGAWLAAARYYALPQMPSLQLQVETLYGKLCSDTLVLQQVVGVVLSPALSTQSLGQVQ